METNSNLQTLEDNFCFNIRLFYKPDLSIFAKAPSILIRSLIQNGGRIDVYAFLSVEFGFLFRVEDRTLHIALYNLYATARHRRQNLFVLSSRVVERSASSR